MIISLQQTPKPSLNVSLSYLAYEMCGNDLVLLSSTFTVPQSGSKEWRGSSNLIKAPFWESAGGMGAHY